MNVIFGMKSGKTISSSLNIEKKDLIYELKKNFFVIFNKENDVFINLRNMEYVEILNDTDKL